jgi:hypothetical protein
MTNLNKPVHRVANRVKATKNGRIELPDGTGFISASARPVIVSLLPSDVLQFRIKGTQRRYKMHMATGMGVAQALELYQGYENRMEEYKKKKSAGYKVRKPTLPKNIPLGNYLRKVLRAIL